MAPAVARVISVFADPGQAFAVVKARPLAQIASTRHVMLVFENKNLESEYPLSRLAPADGSPVPAGSALVEAINSSQAAPLAPGNPDQ